MNASNHSTSPPPIITEELIQEALVVLNARLTETKDFWRQQYITESNRLPYGIATCSTPPIHKVITLS